MCSVDYRLDIAPGECDPLLATENLQQHRDPLVCGHAGIDRQMAPKRIGQQADPVAGFEQAPRKLNDPIALAATDFLDDGVGDPCRLQSIHHETPDAWTPTGGAPLQRNEHESIARKKRRLAILRPAADGAALAQPGRVDGEILPGEQVQRDALAVGLQLGRGPIGHRFTPPPETAW
jgi:hypothetical protein